MPHDAMTPEEQAAREIVMEAEVERLTGIIQETYTLAEEDHRRLFEVLAENERLRAEWKDSDEQFQHVYAQRVDEMNAAEARARKAQARVRELEAEVSQAKQDATDAERSRCARLCWSWGEGWMAREILKGEGA